MIFFSKKLSILVGEKFIEENSKTTNGDKFCYVYVTIDLEGINL